MHPPTTRMFDYSAFNKRTGIERANATISFCA